MTTELRTAAPRLPEGVYLNLPPAEYFAQPAMGSSDWTKLDQHREGWWMASRHNPDRVEPKGRYLMYGTALHVILLEGLAAYDRAFICEPDPRQFPGLARTKDEIQREWVRAGLSLAGTSGWSKDQWRAQAAYKLPSLPIWSNILDDWSPRAIGKTIVSATEDRMLRHMHDVVTAPDRPDNADVRRLFTLDPDHPPLAEVSVFAEVDGIWCRWRFDRLLPRAILDLKSLGNWTGRPLDWEVGEVTARRRWHIQRADYYDGRAIARRLIHEGKLFGGEIEHRRYLEHIIDEPNEAFIWACYQVPSPAGRAAVMMPVWDDTGSDLHSAGARRLARAKAFFRAAVARYGLEKPWARVEPLHYSSQNRTPSIPYPHWIGDDDPVDAAAYETETPKDPDE
jgi:hypothetical protein